jgi:hypothetical protein
MPGDDARDTRCTRPSSACTRSGPSDQTGTRRRPSRPGAHFLERYAESDTLVCTAHFALPSVGRIVAKRDAFFEAEADW